CLCSLSALPRSSTLFPYTTLFRSVLDVVQIFEKVQMVGIYIQHHCHSGEKVEKAVAVFAGFQDNGISFAHPVAAVEHGEGAADRSEEHTSELQSRFDLVCRLLLEK